MTPNGLEMSRPASQGQYRTNGADLAGRVGSIELLGGIVYWADHNHWAAWGEPNEICPAGRGG